MKKGVLRLFVQEVIRQKGNSRIVKDFIRGKKNVMEFLYNYDDIDASLYWADTIQGHDFWGELNDEFNMFYSFYKENDNTFFKS